jgi:hypothetical protein
VELLLPDEKVLINTHTLIDANGKTLQEANNNNQIYLPVEREVPVGAVLRQKVK